MEAAAVCNACTVDGREFLYFDDLMALELIRK
jgi:hypothetical protein